MRETGRLMELGWTRHGDMITAAPDAARFAQVREQLEQVDRLSRPGPELGQPCSRALLAGPRYGLLLAGGIRRINLIPGAAEPAVALVGKNAKRE
jgi:hypothetical protein